MRKLLRRSKLLFTSGLTGEAKGAEKSLLDAIARLKRGTPNNPVLQERSRTGKLKVNPTTASAEAGCSRRLAYEFARVRLALGIDRAAGMTETDNRARNGRKSLQEIVINLRADKAELKIARDAALLQAAELVIQLDRLMREEVRKTRREKRLQTRSHDGNIAPGGFPGSDRDMGQTE